MGNQALTLNPPVILNNITAVDIHITTHGSDWYFAAFSVFALFSLMFMVGAYVLRPANERLFFFSSIFSLFVMSIAYFTMASNLGWTGIQAEFNHVRVSPSILVPGIRQIFYARYIGWFLAFPGLIFNLAILSAAPWATTLFSILAIDVFVVSLLIGSLIHSTYKWGYFVFGVAALFPVAFNVLATYRVSARTFAGSDVQATVTAIGATTVGLFFIYPIAWALAEGGNVIQPDSEFIFYGILDLCLFVVLGTVFQFMVRTLDFTALGIVSPARPFFHESEKLGPVHSGEREPGPTGMQREPGPTGMRGEQREPGVTAPTQGQAEAPPPPPGAEPNIGGPGGPASV